MKIYLDACCLARLTDDQTQPRVREEAGAVERIFAGLEQGSWKWIMSSPLAEEVGQNPSTQRRAEAEALLLWAADTIEIDALTAVRARHLKSLGYGSYDALHLAAAEKAKVDVLLTTDDKFLKRAARGDGNPLVRVENPLSWEKERRSDGPRQDDRRAVRAPRPRNPGP